MSEVVSVLDLYLRTLRRQHRLCVKFEPAKSILAYGFVGVGIEEVDQHELFRVPRKIVRKRIYETLLALKVGAIETFTEIQPMGSLSRVEARPVLRTLRSQGIEPFLVLRDLCFSFLEFVAAQGHGLKNDWTMRQSLNAQYLPATDETRSRAALGLWGCFGECGRVRLLGLAYLCGLVELRLNWISQWECKKTSRFYLWVIHLGQT